MLGDRFVRGRSRFFDRLPQERETTAKVYIKVRLAGLPEDLLAQLDTGAAWSVLAPDVARAAGVAFGIGERVALISRFGLHQGRLLRLPITFIAEEGESLDTEGTFFVATDWPSDVSFLGYSGLLSNIRFALDPQANDFYFGPS